MEKVFIAPNASVRGDVTFGKGVSVWYGAVIRADVEKIIIGDNTFIAGDCTLPDCVAFAPSLSLIRLCSGAIF